MIIEIARLTIDPSNKTAFEAAVAEAAPLFQGAKGCLSMSLEQIIETPGCYDLRVTWETLEAHTVDFRSSEAFQAWRALAGPFFTAPPMVEHSQIVSAYF